MYTTKILDIFKNPLNAGGLQGANGVGKYVDADCGDYIKLYLKINDGVIEEARFKAMGSVCTIVAGSSVCSCLLDCTIQEALNINKDRIYEISGKFPAQKEYCATFALNAVKLAIEDYKERLETELKKDGKKEPKQLEKKKEEPVKQQPKQEKTITNTDTELIDKFLADAQKSANDLAEISQRHFDSYKSVNIYPSSSSNADLQEKKEEKATSAKAIFDAMFEE